MAAAAAQNELVLHETLMAASRFLSAINIICSALKHPKLLLPASGNGFCEERDPHDGCPSSVFIRNGRVEKWASGWPSTA